MIYRSIALAFILSISTLSFAKAENLTVATWNIANLHHQTGESLRKDGMPRREIDYKRLRHIAEGLQADVVALQEIGSPAALARIFDDNDFHLVISDRYQLGDEDKEPKDRDIFVSFAISKAAFTTLPQIRTLNAFAITHFDVDRYGNPEARPTRAALELTLVRNGQTVRILNLHLKSSCHNLPITVVEDQNPTSGERYFKRYDCRTQKAQLSILENYVEMEKQIGNLVILAGDLNRALNQKNNGDPDEFWADLNDGTPDALTLIKGPEDKDTVCWTKHEKRFDEHIDFVIVDAALSKTKPVIEKRGLGFDDHADYAEDASDRNAPRYRQRLSDHCPVVAKMDF